MVNITLPPLWKVTYLNGYESAVNREWYYHFREGGYSDIHYLDVLINSAEYALVSSILRDIHLPGFETSTGYRIQGYADSASYVSYL